MVNCVALADVESICFGYANRKTSSNSEALARKGQYKDYRKDARRSEYRLFCDLFGTPDHLHALTMLDSVSAGKNVYVEKPIAQYDRRNAQIMVKAQETLGKSFKWDQWQRSGFAYA